MWSVVFTVALLCGASLGNPLKFEIPREYRPESPLDSHIPEYRSPISTPARARLVELLKAPETRARLVEEIERLFEETKLPCTSNLRTTMFVALLHLEGNLVAVETGLFKERAVQPLLEELDTATRTKVVDAIHMVSKELLEEPIMEGLGSGEMKRNEYVEEMVLVLRRLETVIRSRESFTLTDLELVLRPLFTSLSKVHDCSLLISHQQILDVCHRIIARMTKPGLLETSLKTLEHTLTTTIRDDTTATYMRDMLETLTTKYVSLMTYTMTSLMTMLRTEVRPTALLVDWMYCLTMMPTSRIEASKYIEYPVATTFQEFPTTFKYPHTTFLASTMVPPVSPLAHLIIIVYQTPYPVHESYVPIQKLKESVWSEVRELSLPKPTEACYPQRMAAYNSVLVVLLNMVDRMMLNSTCFELVKELAHSDALPHYMEKSQKQALLHEVMRLKTELLLPQTVAIETLIEVPELFTILKSSNLLEFINYHHDIPFPTLISTIKNTLNLVKITPSLCNVKVHSINRRIGHVLTTIGSSLPWESVETKLTEALLNFCEMHKLTISKPSLYKVISSLRPVFEMRTNHKLSLVDELMTCFLKERIIPDVLANLLITMKIKITDLEKFISLPTSTFPRETSSTHITIDVTKIPMKRYPVYDTTVQRLKESVWSEVRELSLPTQTESCYPQRLAAYNSVLVVLLNTVNRMMLTTTCTDLVKEISYSNALPLYMEKSQKQALIQEVMRLKTKLLMPQIVAVETLIEVPELLTILRSSNLVELINSPHDITFPRVISTLKSALNLIKTSDSLCHVEVHSMNRRIEHVLTTIRSSLTWEAVETKLTEGLLNFCEIHMLTISKPYLFEIISHVRPVFEMYANHKLIIVTDLLTCFHEERVIPDVLANLLITMKIKSAHLEKFITLPTSTLPREMVSTHINIDFTTIPMQKHYPVNEITVQRLKESVWSEVRELNLPTSTESCYPQRLAAYNSVLVMLLNTVNRMMFNTTCTDLVKEISYSNALPLHMETSQKPALWQEVMRLKTELLLPTIVAVETLLEVPELHTILRSSDLVELINSPHDITFPSVISKLKNALNLIKTSDSLCHVEVHSINRRIEHILTTIRSSLTWEAVETKLTEGLLNFCEMHMLTISNPHLYKIISRIMPVFEMHANYKLSIVNDILIGFREEHVIPDVLADLLITMKIRITDLEKFITLPTSTLPRETVLPHINIDFSKISMMDGLKYFPEGKLEDLPEIRMLSFPSKSDPCFIQRFTAINTLLVELLHGADRKAMDTTLGELLTSSDFSFERINPEILRSVISTLSSGLFLPERNAMETYLEIPELRNILRTSEVFKVIKYHDFTFRDIMTAIKTDLHLIKESRSLCAMDVTRVQHLLTGVLATMETSFSVERMEPRLFTLLRTNFMNIISESLIHEIVNRITPVLEIANRRRASLIDVIKTDIRLELIPADVLSHILLTFKKTEFRITSRDEYTHYYPRSSVASYKKALLAEVQAIRIPLPTEPCYSQKVAAYHAVLVKLLHGLNSTIIETTLHHFLELPSVRHLLTSLENMFHPEMIAITLKKELYSEIEAIKAVSEVPEVHRLLEESELVHLVKARIDLTFPAVIAALKDDLKTIRKSDYLCTADVYTVLLNAEHYLTTLRMLFSWETIQHKLITGLRRTFEKIGLVHEISDYKLIVNELRPVFERLTLPYINTVQTLRSTLRHERISTDLLYHTLITLHQLLVPTADIRAMEEPFTTLY